MTDKKVKYTKMNIDGRETGYVTWMEGSEKHEIIAPAYSKLIKIVNGNITKTRKTDVLIWTQVAGDMGMDELLKQLNIGVR